MHAGTTIGAVSLVALLGACGSGNPAGPPAAAGIAVSNLTSGDPVETDGYLVRLDGDQGHPLPVGGSVLLEGLEPGDHRLELAGVAAGCAVLGANPRDIHTQPALTTQSRFLVTCTIPGTGRVFITTYTYGEGAGDYLIQADDAPGRRVGAKDTLTIRALPPGPVTLFLSGTEPCSVIIPNPRTIQVRAGEAVRSLFKVNCISGPSPGLPLLAPPAGLR
jgi:hypothetical protein